MKKKKRISILLFLIGFGIILYPIVSRTYYDMRFRDEAIQITEDLVNDEQSDELYKEQLDYNESEISNPEEIESADVGFVEKSKEADIEQTNYLANENVIGILSIPAIDLVYPIYDGATDEHLLNGVARIEGTSYPVGGMNTNSVISGHNGMVGRTYFSDIKNLVSGDIIEIQNRKELLTYEFYDSEVIEPDNLGALAVVAGQDTVTLLTCTWPPPGTHRYLVYAKRIPNREREEQNQRTSLDQLENENKNNKYLILKDFFEKIRLMVKRYGIIILMIILAITALYYIFIREK